MGISLLGVIVAAIVNMIIGSLWYSKAFFGKQWRKVSGMSEASMDKGKSARNAMLLMAVAALVMAYMLGWFISYIGAYGASAGLEIGFLAWLGFIAPTFLALSAFERRSWTLFLISSGYYLVALLVTGAILGAWLR